jgi:phosphoheptose isomerase
MTRSCCAGAWVSFDTLEEYGHATDNVWVISRRGDDKTRAAAIAQARSYDKQFIGQLADNGTTIVNVASTRAPRENTSAEMRSIIFQYPEA